MQLRDTALIFVIFLLILSGKVDAQQPRLQVVASFSILADVAQQVAGDAADVTSLLPMNSDPHSFSPAPQDLVQLAEADVVFINGANFEEGLLEAIENAEEEMNIVVASSCVEILPFSVGDHDHEENVNATEEALSETASSEPSAIAEQCAGHYAQLGIEEHEAEAEGDEANHNEPLGKLYELACGGHEEEAAREEHEHEEGNCDPHVWTDPHNVMLWALYICDMLVSLDPNNEALYEENTLAYIETLEALDTEVEVLVNTLPEANRVLITNHETLGYFAAHYDFELVGVVLGSGTTIGEPGAAEVAALADLIRAADVTAIFAENTANATLIQQLADETGVRVITLYSDSLSEPEGQAGTYLDYLRYNTQTIVEALA